MILTLVHSLGEKLADESNQVSTKVFCANMTIRERQLSQSIADVKQEIARIQFCKEKLEVVVNRGQQNDMRRRWLRSTRGALAGTDDAALKKPKRPVYPTLAPLAAAAEMWRVPLSSSQQYYFHVETRETMWEKPIVIQEYEAAIEQKKQFFERFEMGLCDKEHTARLWELVSMNKEDKASRQAERELPRNGLIIS